MLCILLTPGFPKWSRPSWIVPAYTCSHGAESLAIMRVVVKENFSYVRLQALQ